MSRSGEKSAVIHLVARDPANNRDAASPGSAPQAETEAPEEIYRTGDPSALFDELRGGAYEVCLIDENCVETVSGDAFVRLREAHPSMALVVWSNPGGLRSGVLSLRTGADYVAGADESLEAILARGKRLSKQRRERRRSRTALNETRVLVVDDEEIVRSTMCDALERDGKTVHCAADAYEAFGQLQRHDIHVMVTDLMMPEVSGNELLAAMRRYDPSIKAVIVTGFPELDSAMTALRAGACDYLIKPVETNHLRDVVNDAWTKWVVGVSTPHSQAGAEAASVRVLLGEDSPEDAQWLKDLLAEDEGYYHFEVVEAADIDTALAHLEAATVDVVLSKLDLPGTRGLETIIRLRAGARPVPVIVLGEAGSKVGAEQAALVGAEDHLVKGECTAALIQAKLGSAIDHQRLSSTVERIAKLVGTAEERHFSMIDRSSDAMLVISAGGLVLFANRAAGVLFGRDASEMVGFPFGFPLGGGEKSVEIDIVQRGGDPRSGELRVVEIQWDGEPAHMAAIRDITDRRNAEAALKRSEQGFRSLIEGSPDAIAVHRDERLIYVNPALATLLGHERPELLIGTRMLDIVHPEERTAAEARLNLENLQVDPKKPAPRFEQRYLHVDGSVVTLEVAALRLVFDGEFAVVAIGRDVTDRKRAEDLQNRLAHADRLASVGKLAAGVAHEVNNPAQYVLMNIESALDLVDDLRGASAVDGGPQDAASALGELTQVLDGSLDGIKRIGSLVAQLRVFSRLERDDVGPVDVHDVVHTACNISDNEIRHRATLVTDLSIVPPIRGDSGKLCQVLVNLLVNASHAIPEGDPEEQRITVSTEETPDSVVVAVEDTGCGVPENLRQRIFDPFFTTKSQAEGTGLGLSLSAEIVRSHGGDTRVTSRVGEGSRFEITLPKKTRLNAANTQRDSITQRAPMPAPATSDARYRILIIDDEPMIRDTVGRFLGKRHKVVVADGGVEGLKILEQDREFDVILCDIMMPQVDGTQVYAFLAEIAPELTKRIIFISGGAVTQKAKTFVETEGVRVADKPFTRQHLLDLVNLVGAESKA